MKKPSLVFYFLLSTFYFAPLALSQAPTTTNKGVTIDANGNVLPATVNGHVPSLPAGTTLAGAAIVTGTGLPSQTGNSGKYLTTNGTAASWATIDLSSYQTKAGVLALGGFSSITGRVGNANLPLGAQLYDNAGTPSLVAAFGSVSVTNAQKRALTGLSVGQIVRITDSLSVSGSDVSVAYRGLYIPSGTQGGKSTYTLVGFEPIDFTRTFFYGNGAWQLDDADTNAIAVAFSDTEHPWEATGWIQDDSVTPSNIVTASPALQRFVGGDPSVENNWEVVSITDVNTTGVLSPSFSSGNSYFDFSGFHGSGAGLVDLVGDDTAYDATSWNGNTNVPTKNAVRDKIESLTFTSAPALSISGQTGLLSFTGLASTNRIKTVRDAADTILELGGSYTPSGTWTNMTLVTPALGTPSAIVLTNATGSPTGISLTLAQLNTIVSDDDVAGLAASNTFTGANINSKSGAASVSAMKYTGVPFAGTGTTSFPLLYLNDSTATASTTLSTSGTYLGVNGHGSADLLNLLLDGTSKFKVTSGGALTTAGSVNAIGGIAVSGNFAVDTSGQFKSSGPGDTVIDTQGAVFGRRGTSAKTTNYTVTSANSGTFFTNAGASGTVNFTLPTAAAGLYYTFYVDAAQTLTITAGASTTIQLAGSTSASAGNVTTNTVGNCITLVGISTTKWVAQSHEGTWTVN